MLQKVNMTLASKEQCSALYNRKTAQLKNSILDATMLCASTDAWDLDDNICAVTMPLT